MKQLFKRGNLVHIAKDLGMGNRHFEGDEDVIVVGSYAEQYGDTYGNAGVNYKKYEVMFKNGDTSAWYKESQLTLISGGGEHLFDEIIINNN